MIVPYSSVYSHKAFGQVTSPLQWKSLTQQARNSEYKRNFDLLSIIPIAKSNSSSKIITVSQSIKKRKLEGKRIIKEEKYVIRKRNYSLTQESMLSLNSIDRYNQLAMKNIRNYNDTDDDVESSCSGVNRSMMKNDLTRISESKLTRNNSANASFVMLKPQVRIKKHVVVGKKAPTRKSFMLNAINVCFKL